MRFLLAEDSVRLQQLLSETLRSAGYRLDVVGRVAEIHESAAAVCYDLMIVDLGLPDGDGIEAIQKLRRHGYRKPILVITARGSVDDRICGLDSGADDYLTKPFNHGELLARVRALMRRQGDAAEAILSVGNVTLDPSASEVRCGEVVLDLRLSERRLLDLLMRRAGTVVAKSALEAALSEFGREISPNAVEALVSRTRKVMWEASADISIETVRGVGYILRLAEKPIRG
jgi:two-component system OmpR family response regulator